MEIREVFSCNISQKRSRFVLNRVLNGVPKRTFDKNHFISRREQVITITNTKMAYGGHNLVRNSA